MAVNANKLGIFDDCISRANDIRGGFGVQTGSEAGDDLVWKEEDTHKYYHMKHTTKVPFIAKLGVFSFGLSTVIGFGGFKNGIQISIIIYVACLYS